MILLIYSSWVMIFLKHGREERKWKLGAEIYGTIKKVNTMKVNLSLYIRIY